MNSKTRKTEIAFSDTDVRMLLLLREVYEHPGIPQRKLAQIMNVSLGTVNRLIAEASSQDLLSHKDGEIAITETGTQSLQKHKAERAVILAAGFGSRFVPLTWETPKGLLPVFGERMIERQIRQLHEAGIQDIYIMVGYLKEKFDYLIDKYAVKLIYNPEYASKNTIATLHYAKDIFLGHNTYLLSSDNWLRDNMYHAFEPCSWYAASYTAGNSSEWFLTYNKKNMITDVNIGGSNGWFMYGPAYFTQEFSESFFPELERYYQSPGTENFYWEQVYMDWLKMRPGFTSPAPFMYINRQPEDQIYEFENLEELRQFDEKYLHSSDNEAMHVISRTFNVPESEINGIRCLKAGMTNRSFLFTLQNRSYICRVPGEGTDQLINRRDEAENIQAVRPLGITEEVIFFDRESGYKISRYYPDARCAEPANDADMKRCMDMIRGLHTSGIKVSHDFDIAERLCFYENLCLTHGGIPFEDYPEVRKKSLELISMLSSKKHPKVLSHIDCVADNFLFIEGGSVLKLIDWEYAGMADPLIDIAMCAIYSYMDKAGADRLMHFYGTKDSQTVYAYMALGGLLWALWAVYKSSLGVSFGEYTLIMYRYAKDFYKEAMRAAE